MKTNLRHWQVLLVSVCTFLVLVFLSGQRAAAAALSPAGQAAFTRGIAAAQQEDYKLAWRYLLEAQAVDPEVPIIWFNLGLAAAKLPDYELRAMAWLQAYLLAEPEAPNREAIQQQLTALEVAFESKAGKLLDRLEPLVSTDNTIHYAHSFYSAFGRYTRGVYYSDLAYARSYLGDFKGGLKVIRTSVRKESWPEALAQNPAIEPLSGGGLNTLVEGNRLDYLKGFGRNGLSLDDARFNDTQLTDYVNSAKDQATYAKGTFMWGVLSSLHDLARNYRAINGKFDPGRHPDPYWRERYAEAYESRANTWLVQEDFSRALADYDQALELGRKDTDLYRNKGLAFDGLGRYAEALEIYDNIIAKDPGDIDAYYKKIADLENLGRQAEALEVYNKIIGLRPEDPDAYYQKAFALSALERYGEAVEMYNKVLILRPDEADAYYGKGCALDSLGRSVEALATYDQAIRLNPADARYYYNKGVVLDGLGRQADAIQMYDQALKLAPEDGDGYSRKVADLVLLGRNAEAVAVYDKLIELSGDDAELYANRGIALGLLGRDQEAVEMYSRAIELAPEAVEYHKSKGFALGRLGRDEEAVEAYGQAEAVERNNMLQEYTYLGKTLKLAPKSVFDITGKVANAYVSISGNGSDSYAVSVELKDSVKEEFRKFSEQNIGREAGVGYKDKLVILATMREPLAGGSFQITGKYTMKELQNLAEEVKGQ